MKNKEIRNKLNKTWGIPDRDYWIPLDFQALKSDIEYFEYHSFESNFGVENLKEIIQKINLGKIYEISEDLEDNEIKVYEIHGYEMLELFYTNESADWVVYLSHENTITIAGGSLLREIKKEWVHWKNWNRPYEKNLNNESQRDGSTKRDGNWFLSIFKRKK